jgi:hypothetical protein
VCFPRAIPEIGPVFILVGANALWVLPASFAFGAATFFRAPVYLLEEI